MSQCHSKSVYPQVIVSHVVSPAELYLQQVIDSQQLGRYELQVVDVNQSDLCYLLYDLCYLLYDLYYLLYDLC